MSDLLDHTLHAHGGLDRWRRVRSIHVQGSVGGLLWGSRGQEGVFATADFVLDVRRQHLVYHDFTGPGLRGVFTPGWVWIEDRARNVLTQRRFPRMAFTGHGPDSPWDRLHALYFGGYAMWNYLTAPFLLTMPGVQVEELEPWEEAGERRRRLRAVFPEDIATHSREQVFHFDSTGLLRRHDYAAEVLGASPAAHYSDTHKEVSGLVFPTRRRVVPVREDGRSIPTPVLVAIDLTQVTVH
ncbi:hypothetical protein ACIO93_42970 [Streptomyces sp. NPDC087903]|uniref:hypothetical protein n=1 Tax=Streptomyces sp. NPDC087903 TaxID=3365819 RepID=UPI00381F212C